MSRTHARVDTTIWANQDWRALSAGAQWTYLMILSQPDLSHAGTVTFNPTKWSKSASGLALGHIESRIDELAASRFIVYDDETFEVLIRSFIRNDGVAKQPKVLMSACRAARSTVSPLIRAELAYELSRVDEPKYAHAAELLAKTLADLAPEGAPESSPSLTNEQKRVSASSSNPQEPIVQNRRKKGFPELPERGGGGGGGYCSSKSTTLFAPSKEREEENRSFQAFCEAYPKDVPSSQRVELQARWQSASNVHGADRVLKAAQRYTSAMDAAGTERKFAKNPVVWLKDGLFVEHLPDELEPYQGMDVVAWLDEVTARRDVNTAKRYATGDDYLPEWPAEYEGWTAAEVEAFRESDKDRWFREHRALHIEVLSRRYGGASDVA